MGSYSLILPSTVITLPPVTIVHDCIIKRLAANARRTSQTNATFTIPTIRAIRAIEAMLAIRTINTIDTIFATWAVFIKITHFFSFVSGSLAY